MTVAVLGAGAFGTALAISLARKTPVTLWCRDEEHAGDMRKTRENRRRLAGAPFPEHLTVTSDIAEIGGNATLLLAVPMQQMRGFLRAHHLRFCRSRLVACCKGIELATGLGPISVIQDTVPGATAALLTGPSFAADIARGLPTALTLACDGDSKGYDLQKQLSTDNLRLYRTTDLIGAEIGGALKNVIAIACGAVIGAKLGDSARAALMTRGYAEMQRLALARGAKAATLAGLSGFGDLALTCTSEQSRNFRLGLSLGQGTPFDPSVTVEGAATARATAKAASAIGLEMPITQTVTNLLDHRLTIADAADQLLKRPLKEE
ncbi:NAD(P)H-dependent glycerol-3-phosphate dehydrogenase [Phaeobacter sp. B1627]|uniref:NAD(P)H-dependent glycerol-3-phosphate dehydrogenase n=1 Tax=Phaeobacter sp. B1627 TaxID=2583809 RepID=UPI00111BB055|nr:NAD(P)H-dependent glycerol-3-phosphate dehydrogenase [Phaeobacter sp. B1627]TNJ45495.1 NAD(P)-dependent glycerol-3-phosphate dehydrogenase [Phaeobacter sp. B1627]